jgi:hypothetical protein
VKVGDLVCYAHDRECRGLILERHVISGDALVLWCDSVGEKYDTDRRTWHVEHHNVEVISESR